MNAEVYSLEEALSDSTALAEIAETTGVSQDVVKRIAAELAALPVRQAIRICVAAEQQRTRRRRR